MSDGLNDVYTTKANGKRSFEVNNPISENPAVEHFMYQELADVVILNNPVQMSNQIDLQAGHGFVAPVSPNRDYLNIHYDDVTLPGFLGARFSQHAVTAVNVNQITITPPLAYDFISGKEESTRRVNVNMGLNGSITPVRFISHPPNGQIWDLHRFIIDMILATAGDDGKFGNLAQLTNGIYYGFESPEYTEYQISIFDNGGYRASAFDLEYPLRAGGGGDFAMACRKSISRTGSVVTLRGNADDKFVKYVQDDLSGLVRYRVKTGGVIAEGRSVDA